MKAEWYYSRDGEEHGPYSAAALVAMVKKGDLLPTDFLWKEGMRDWRLAGDFPKLFGTGDAPASNPKQSPEQPAVTVSPTPSISPKNLAGSAIEASTAPAASESADPSSLKGLTMALGIGPADSGQDPLLGRDIGGVRIVRLIAEGGMGRVYEGRQEKPNRTVAVKVMRPGLTSPSILKRFEYEAEVLARLQHPGIAHIYSVGVHQMGNASVPYFVMEYIADARTLTKYAADLKLPTRQRLDLFRSVCDAVAHGHQKGVIHRDLKPSNILVDATGQPKVIDFGVARATDSDMALTTMQTDVGQLIGTLQYMSPEQFKADPNDIDVRSDVYALGVILYELLAGKMPYDVKKKAIHEVARMVQEDDPKALSSFNRALKGDVAVIAGKCLEKDRGRRYSSASELGSDVGRYLSGEAISASPPGFVDGLMRLAKKHRATAAAAAGVFIALVIAVIAIGIFAAQADEARRRAQASRVIAEREREKAERAQAASDQERKQAVHARVTAEAAEKRAQQEKAVATKRLYQANLYRLGRMAAGDRSGSSKELFDATAKICADDRLPVDLHVLRAALDGATTVLDGFSDKGILAVSQDATLCAAACDDHSIRLYSTASAKASQSLRGHTGTIVALAFSRDGKTLASASEDHSVRLWDTATARERTILSGHKGPLIGLVFSHDGSMLATFAKDNTARIWDPRTNALQHTLTGHGAPVRCANFSTDGKLLATGSDDHTVRLWKAANGEHAQTLKGHGNAVVSVSFSPDGQYMATGGLDGKGWVWDISAGVQTARLDNLSSTSNTGVTRRVAFAPSGRALGDLYAGIFTLWDVSNVAHKGDAEVGDQVEFPHVELKGAWEQGTVVECGNAQCRILRQGDAPSALGSWVHRADLRVLASLPKRFSVGGRVTCFAFTDDGHACLTGSENGSARLWNCQSGEQVGLLVGHDSPIRAVSCKGVPGSVVSLDSDGCMRLWDDYKNVNGCVVLSSTSTIPTDNPKPSLAAATISPNSLHVATGNSAGAVTVWDRFTGDPVATFEDNRPRPEQTGPVTGLYYSQDGNRLMATYRGWRSFVAFWDAATGTSIATVATQSAFGDAAALSCAGDYAATGGDDGVVQFWDSSTGVQVSPWLNRPLLSASEDGNARHDLLIDDFDREGWGDWRAEGDAFGRGPVVLPADGPRKKEGAARNLCVSSINPGVSSTGTVSSPSFKISRRYIIFSMSSTAGNEISLTVDGTAIYRAQSIEQGKLSPMVWDVGRWVDKEAQIKIVDNSTAKGLGIVVDAISQADKPDCLALRRSLCAHAGRISDLAFSPDGQTLLTVSCAPTTYFTTINGLKFGEYTIPADNSVRTWSLTTGELLAYVPIMAEHWRIGRAVFAPDSKRFVIGEGNDAVIRATATGSELLRLSGHKAAVTMATFSSNGALLATAARDKTARLWNASTGELVAMLTGHADVVTRVEFSGDGDRLLTVGMDGKGRLWDTFGGDLLLEIGDERLHIQGALIAPDSSTLISWSTEGSPGAAAIWGLSNAAANTARVGDDQLRNKVATLVDGWFAKPDDSFQRQLMKAKGVLTPAEYRVAANSVLRRHYEASRGYLLQAETLTGKQVESLLAQYSDEAIWLRRLVRLDVASARALARFKGKYLTLAAVRDASPDALAALAEFRGDLSLNAIASLSGESAKALASCEGDLYLNGVSSLSDDAARNLAKYRGRGLYLDGISSLSESAAKSLAERTGVLSLNGLGALSLEVATALATQTKGALSLDGLTAVATEAVVALAGHTGGALSLDRIGALTVDEARAFSRHKGFLSLHGVSALSDEAAEALSRHTGGLSVGLTTLSPQAAKAFARHKNDLFLDEVKELSDEAAKAIADHEDDMWLRGIQVISEHGRQYLLRNPKIRVPERLK